MIVDCAIYRNGRRTPGPEDFSDALAEARASGDAFLWIGLHEPTEEEFSRVTSEFALHPLAVEDALTAHQRPKLEVYDDSLFMVLKPTTYDPGTYTVTTGELMVFVGDSFVVTVRHGEGAALSVVRQRLEHNPDLLRHGPTAVLYAVSDAVVDHYIEVADELQTDLEDVEAEVFAPAPDSRAAARAARRESGRPGDTAPAVQSTGSAQSTAARIYNFKRQVQEFRRATGPLAAPMQKLTGAAVPFVDADSRPFFRDVNDHLTHANELVDGLDRLLSDVLAAHLAQMGVRQNDDMRKISAWAAMAAVPTLVAGVYGMNFDHMPELHWIWSYPAVIALMLVVVSALHRGFKRRGWL